MNKTNPRATMQFLGRLQDQLTAFMNLSAPTTQEEPEQEYYLVYVASPALDEREIDLLYDQLDELLAVTTTVVNAKGSQTRIVLTHTSIAVLTAAANLIYYLLNGKFTAINIGTEDE